MFLSSWKDRFNEIYQKKFLILILLILTGCSVADEGNSADSAIRINKLGTSNVTETDEDAADSYSLNFAENTTTTRFFRASEESFTHETDIWDFEKEEDSFSYTYIDHNDKEVTKEFTILSNSVVKDEKNNIRYEWFPPAAWVED